MNNSTTGSLLPTLPKTAIHPFQYSRRVTREVKVGHVGVGGNNPLRIQSMTTTPTEDTKATVEQTIRLVNVGCEIVRITAPTILDAKNLENIKNTLLQKGYTVPLVADIHFRPDAAMEAANFVEKVRVNPGNFVDGKAFKVREYTEIEYQDELKRIEDKFTPLVLKLKKLNRALRIGSNHGSLSDRIMNRYGDTPLGMVESALEFLQVCLKNDYHQVIFSMKASNPRVMVAAYRLLADRLAEQGWNYPFHLGVTEAGYAEDGRIKSAVGIGSLLEDGIGDTIRVSLTEDPEFEIPVAQEIARRYDQRTSFHARASHNGTTDTYVTNRYQYSRRITSEIQLGPIVIGGTSPMRVVSSCLVTEPSAQKILNLLEERLKKDAPPEILVIPYSQPDFNKRVQNFYDQLQFQTSRLAFCLEVPENPDPAFFQISCDAYIFNCEISSKGDAWAIVLSQCQASQRGLILKAASVSELQPFLDQLRQKSGLKIMVTLKGRADVQEWRSLVLALEQQSLDLPILLSSSQTSIQLGTACVMGSLICDGIGDAVMASLEDVSHQQLDFAYNLLQAAGSRITKTEYVSCPSCGRTLFDLQSTTERIKSKTHHLKGVKIAIMGCIVNGPGEMADADFGYVGGGPGKINLYVGKTCVEKSIPAELADQRLIELIKQHGKWVDPA